MSDRGVALRLTGVRKAFRSPDGESLTVIDVPSFELAQGEQVALRGASGSGKTTLLNLIAGILDADAGSIEVDGADRMALRGQRAHRRAPQLTVAEVAVHEQHRQGVAGRPGPQVRAG